MPPPGKAFPSESSSLTRPTDIVVGRLKYRRHFSVLVSCVDDGMAGWSDRGRRGRRVFYLVAVVGCRGGATSVLDHHAVLFVACIPLATNHGVDRPWCIVQLSETSHSISLPLCIQVTIYSWTGSGHLSVFAQSLPHNSLVRFYQTQRVVSIRVYRFLALWSLLEQISLRAAAACLWVPSPLIWISPIRALSPPLPTT